MAFFQCYIVPLKGEYHINDIGLEYLKRDDGYGYSVNRPIKKGTILMFVHTPSKFFVGETVATKSRFPSRDKRWKYEVGYDPNAIFRYDPYIPYRTLSGIPTHFKGVDVHAIVRNYPQLYLNEYQMMTKGISKIKI